MDSTLLLLKLIPLLLLCCTGPGLLLATRLRCSPTEKLCTVFATSFVAVYLASFALFILHASSPFYVLTSLLLAAMALPGWPTARILLRRRATRRTLLCFVALLAWYALHMVMVRIYAGGDWQGDWQEHFQRTQFFLHDWPANSLFLGVYSVPARPPMFNLIASFFCAQVGLNFQAYQIVCLFLNGWAFLPCCLLIAHFAPKASRHIPLLMVLFMLNPSIVQNATLTVTKAFTAGLVILGLCFYLRRRLLPASLALAAAMLAHYSAGPYAAAIGLHSLYQSIRRRYSASQVLTAATAAITLLATWFGWSLLTYGPRVTFLSNTTAVSAEQQSPPQIARKVIFNLISDAFPYPVRRIPARYAPFLPIRNLGDLRDAYFNFSQTTLTTMIGLTSGLIALCLLGRFLFFAPPSPFQRNMSGRKPFWLFFLIFTYFTGVAAVPGWNIYGNAYVCLQPLALIGVTFVAANFSTLSRPVRYFLCFGLAVDYFLGILLEFDRQSYVYPTRPLAGHLRIFPDPTLGTTGAAEYIQKLTATYVFWGDRLAPLAPLMEITSAALALLALFWLLRRTPQSFSPYCDSSD